MFVNNGTSEQFRDSVADMDRTDMNVSGLLIMTGRSLSVARSFCPPLANSTFTGVKSKWLMETV